MALKEMNVKKMIITYSWMSLVIAGILFLGLRIQGGHKVERYGSVVGIKSEKIDYYKKLHADPWPGVLKTIHECNMQNFSIYIVELEKGKFYLFSYFEYTGKDLEADMEKMAADPITQKWWKETDPCQYVIPASQQDKGWTRMEQVFFLQ